jgi:hypothetical protein
MAHGTSSRPSFVVQRHGRSPVGAVFGPIRSAILAPAIAALLGGCASFKPLPLQQIPLRDRLESQERDGVRVSVTVLSRAEARRAFGVDLYDEKIQPVWIRIRNGTETPYWLMLHGLDPNYFSAREAAYKSHFRFRPATNDRMDDHFERLGILPAVPPKGETSGFAFTNVKLGTKAVWIRLLGEEQVEDFHFYLTVPGFKADYSAVDWEALRGRVEFVDLESEEELLDMLSELPCCTTRENGSGQGDPLNLVVIASPRALLAFTRAGWDETELLTWSSAWKTFKAFFGGEYKYSPMSALYYDGRAQSLGLQKARDTIHERNHLRLWWTPWRYKGRNVWVGTITRDIGVYFTTRAWNLATHAIDPDVDEARSYLVEDLLTTESIQTLGLIGGVGEATKADPHRNLMFAPWWTDGRRAIIQLADESEPIPMDEVEFFGFFRFGERIRGARGMTLKGRAGPGGEPVVEDDAGADTD